MCETQLGSETASASSVPPQSDPDPEKRAEILDFVMWVPQKPEEGEDAEPLLKRFDSEDCAVIGVFDGMGGSGSTQYLQAGKNRTGAYIASRLVRESASKFFTGLHESRTGAELAPAEQKAGVLARSLFEELRQRIAELEPAASGARLGGKLMRRLPTTLACLSYRRDAEGFAFEAFWAGDSRCYLLGPTNGLQQITEDDLRSGADALGNLLDDSPMSNFVNADSAFKLNAATGRSNGPCIFLAATDGCFNFCLSPAHFEHSLLATLRSASSIVAWKAALKESLEQLAGDDFSMALIAAGWSTFLEMRDAFPKRLANLSREFIEPLDNLESEINETAAKHKQLVSRRNQLRGELWEGYRKNYEIFRKTAAKGLR